MVTFTGGEDRNSVLLGLTLIGGTGTENSSGNWGGGGILCDGASPTISHNIISDNIVPHYGGALWAISGNPLLYNNIIINNSAGNGGAVYAITQTELRNNIICHNTASRGGGLYLRGPAIVANNIIYGNAATFAEGGGVYSRAQNSIIRIIGNTIVTNSSVTNGANLDIEFSNNVTVTNNIVANALGSAGIYVEQSSVNVNYNNVWNNVGDNYAGLLDQTGVGGNISVDPLFADADFNNYHLKAISPCINAGDTAFVPEAGETDIDGDPRILSGRVDIGADEFNRPIADAGPDQTYNSIPPQITLDGNSSYVPDGGALSYLWRQIGGPQVELSIPNSVQPTFAPSEFGIYVFELVVNDDAINSNPDTIGIVIGNDNAPVANAGLPRYAAQDPVVLDGTGSFDPDSYGELTYQWQQTSGASLTIVDWNTATPTISGFSQTSSIQVCEFELIVSDGVLNSSPDTVDLIIVPSFSDNNMNLENYAFVEDKPTIVFFGGGDCSSGGIPKGWAEAFPTWLGRANIINFSHYEPSYGRCGDMLIAYLSGMAPDYKQTIQTMGHSTGNMPAIDVANYLNLTYADSRYAINRVSFFDVACRNYSGSINTFLSSSVNGEQCWIDNYYATTGQYYSGTLNIYFPTGNHDTPVSWYFSSLNPATWSTDMYHQGKAGGSSLSVIGEGKNLQLATNIAEYYFKWIGDADGPGYLDFYNESLSPGKLPNPITLIGPADGNTVDANGAILTSQVSENSVGYQLLFGPDPYHLDYLISDTAGLPTDIITTFPFETTYWTIKARDQYGTTIYADPIRIKTENTAPPVGNTLNQEYLACIGYELVSEKRLSRTEFEYHFRLKLKNMCVFDVENITVELNSPYPDVAILNDKVFFSSITTHQESLSDDTFIVSINRRTAVNQNDIIWRISDGRERDFSGDGKVNFADFAYLANNWLQAGENMPEDLYQDGIINFIDFTIFAEMWWNN